MRHLSLNLKTTSKYMIFDPNNSELFKTTNKLNDFYLSLKTRKTYQNQAVASILNKLCSMGLKIWMITFLNNIRHMCRKKCSYEWVITIRMHDIWRNRQIRHSHFIICFYIFHINGAYSLKFDLKTLKTIQKQSVGCYQPRISQKENTSKTVKYSIGAFKNSYYFSRPPFWIN